MSPLSGRLKLLSFFVAQKGGETDMEEWLETNHPVPSGYVLKEKMGKDSQGVDVCPRCGEYAWPYKPDRFASGFDHYVHAIYEHDGGEVFKGCSGVNRYGVRLRGINSEGEWCETRWYFRDELTDIHYWVFSHLKDDEDYIVNPVKAWRHIDKVYVKARLHPKSPAENQHTFSLAEFVQWYEKRLSLTVKRKV